MEGAAAAAAWEPSPVEGTVGVSAVLSSSVVGAVAAAAMDGRRPVNVAPLELGVEADAEAVVVEGVSVL